MIKKWIANFLDSICAESYELKDFTCIKKDEFWYIVPLTETNLIKGMICG